MPTAIESTALDFTNIKNNLKTFLASKPEFADFNFEAAGISNLLDVLAYNTHYNGLTANFALNESFLNTAQLRSSVVSHAQTLGYQPRSKTAALAQVNLSLNLAGVANRPTQITLPSGRTFTSAIAGTTYTFQTIRAHYATDDGNGTYVFADTDGDTTVKIYEGTEKTKTFFVGETSERQIYMIPDTTLDTATVQVLAYANPSTTDFVTYLDVQEAVRVTADSQFYQIVEAPNGEYELNFGDGISFGKAPDVGSVIRVTYLSTLGPEANGGTTFTPTADVTVNAVNYPLTVVTTSASAGGAVRQSLESIRTNAPIAFSSQQRLVTAEDYKAQILAKFSNVEDCISWGGQDNVPANYGNVYVSLKFADNVTTSQQTTVKDSILANLTDNLAILSINTVFVDPIETFLEVVVSFDFDPNKTGKTLATSETDVYNIVQNYFTQNLEKFDATFRRSNLLTLVDEIGEFIISSRAEVKMVQRLPLTLNQTLSYTVQYPEELAQPSPTSFIVETGAFTFEGGQTCVIRNKLSSTKLQVVNITNGNVLSDNIGSYDRLAGSVTITGFTPESILSGQSFLNVKVVPENQATVKPLRNYILKFDADASFAQGTIDTQTTKVSLS